MNDFHKFSSKLRKSFHIFLQTLEIFVLFLCQPLFLMSNGNFQTISDNWINW